MESASQSSPRPLIKKVSLLALEGVLVLIILGLLLATWLPAIIGANPDAPVGP